MSKIDELLKNEKVEWKKLGEVCNIKRGRVISKIYLEQHKGEFPVYSSQTRNNGEIGRISTYDFDGEFATWTTDGAYAGTVFYRNGKFSVTNICGLIEPKDSKNLLVKFIVYWLQIEAKKYVKGGSGNPKLMSNVVEKIKIPIPSIETQEKIVKTLDKFTNYVTELQARTKQYEYYRDMLLSEEYLNKISDKIDVLESKDYEVKFTTLGEIAQINRGASPRPITKYITDDIEGIPWIKIGDIGVNSKYVTKTAQKITVEGAKKSRILKKGDFIMSNSMSYGRPYILDIDGAIHDGWASISDFHNILDSDFLYYYLTSYKVQNYWKGKINSSSVSNLNSEIIRSLPIPVIDKELQQVVAKILDKFQSLLADTKGLLPQEIEQRQKQYEYYREKLLTFNENSAKHTHTI
jgi:N-6 DNA methylase